MSPPKKNPHGAEAVEVEKNGHLNDGIRKSDTPKGKPDFVRVVLPNGSQAQFTTSDAAVRQIMLFAGAEMPSAPVQPTVSTTICQAPDGCFALILACAGFSSPSDNGLLAAVSADLIGLAHFGAEMKRRMTALKHN